MCAAVVLEVIQMFETLFGQLWTLLLDISTGIFTCIDRRLLHRRYHLNSAFVLFDGVISIEW